MQQLFSGLVPTSKDSGTQVPTWRSVASNFDLTSGLHPLAHGGGRCSFWNDLSLLQIGAEFGGHSDFTCGQSPENLAMCRAEFAMYAILKSPLIISAYLPGLSDASRDVLTNRMLLNANQDSLGRQARRVKSRTPKNATLSSPRDVQAVLAHCDASRPT